MLTPEQEAQRNLLAQAMMGGQVLPGLNNQDMINQFYDLTEGMRRDPYGDSSGSTGGQGPNTSATGPSPQSPQTETLDQAARGPSHQAPPPIDIPDPPPPPTEQPPTNLEATPVVGVQVSDLAPPPASPFATQEHGYPQGVPYDEPGVPGNPLGNAVDKSGYAPLSGVPGFGLGPALAPFSDKESLLENPEALNAYAGPQAGPLAGAFSAMGIAPPGPEWGGWGQYGYGPQGAYSEYGPSGSEQGFEGQTAAEAAAGSFGGNAAAQDAWGAAYADAIAAGQTDDQATQTADDAVGGVGGVGGIGGYDGFDGYDGYDE